MAHDHHDHHVRSLAAEAAKLTLEELHFARQKVGLCDANGNAVTGFPYPLEQQPLFYVKARDKDRLHPEARTQQFAHDGLERLPQDGRKGIHVPRILRVVEYESGGGGFMVMEYVTGRTLKDILAIPHLTYGDAQAYFDKVSKALQLFLALPAPADAKPGPCGGGIIRHTFFKDFEAAIEYDSVDMLEKHLNKLATLIHKTAPTLTLERALHLVYSDMHAANFLFTDSGDLYVVDFDHAALLPLSFMTFALCFPSMVSMPVADRIKRDFDLPRANDAVMCCVNGLLGMSVLRIGLPL
ncbi:Protein kinase-like domain protein [Niveomyces insectorum RCEF 264]|uniref:Protein kinase-like domain protein n=1 Tax=Niveomyces insectorum RCEF 264 TaxID=1081102 RepID=A0A162MAV4_9HYPO|nr:Protein kinase-like domain protein [Niveomyces insectorum RCEF 264]